MTRTPMDDLSEEIIVEDILREYRKAREVHAPMRGAHEGYAVILEELDELWDEVKASKPSDPRRAAIRREAIQLGAMALAFIKEVCSD